MISCFLSASAQPASSEVAGTMGKHTKVAYGVSKFTYLTILTTYSVPRQPSNLQLGQKINESITTVGPDNGNLIAEATFILFHTFKLVNRILFHYSFYGSKLSSRFIFQVSIGRVMQQCDAIYQNPVISSRSALFKPINAARNRDKRARLLNVMISKRFAASEIQSTNLIFFVFFCLRN